MRKLPRRRQALTQMALLAIGLFVLVPAWGVVYLAFDGSVQGRPTAFHLWPQQFTLEIFQRMWVKPAQTLSFLSLLRNSLIVAGGAALASAAFGAGMAYAFARFRFPGRSAGLFGLMVGALLPPVALMTPLYILLTALRIRTTLFGLMVVYTAFAMPFCVWHMRAAFQSVPREIEESAYLDGAGHWTSFWRVTLPLALPSIVVAALAAFLLGYSEFVMGWLFVDRSENVTLAMAITALISGDNINASWSSLAALAVMMSAPVVALFLIVQRYLTGSLLTGVVDA